jgi:hypothetical protein
MFASNTAVTAAPDAAILIGLNLWQHACTHTTCKGRAIQTLLGWSFYRLSQSTHLILITCTVRASYVRTSHMPPIGCSAAGAGWGCVRVMPQLGDF